MMPKDDLGLYRLIELLLNDKSVRYSWIVVKLRSICRVNLLLWGALGGGLEQSAS